MGLFFDVLSAINNPNQQGNVTQLESIISSIQQLAVNRGIQPSQIQSVMSILGNVLRPALKQQQLTLGSNQLQNLIGQGGQVTGTGMAASGLQSLLTPQLQQQIVQTVSQRTGISPNVIEAALPTLTSTVSGLLSMGSTKSGTLGLNPVLSAFLDSDVYDGLRLRDGNTDLGDVLRFANRFINPHAV